MLSHLQLGRHVVVPAAAMHCMAAKRHALGVCGGDGYVLHVRYIHQRTITVL